MSDIQLGRFAYFWNYAAMLAKDLQNFPCDGSQKGKTTIFIAQIF